jgi:hypothetical protein
MSTTTVTPGSVADRLGGMIRLDSLSCLAIGVLGANWQSGTGPAQNDVVVLRRFRHCGARAAVLRSSRDGVWLEARATSRRAG